MPEAPSVSQYLVRCDRKQHEVWEVSAPDEAQAKQTVREEDGEPLLVTPFHVEITEVVPITQDDRLTECQDCGEFWLESELEEPAHLWERVDPGEAVPAGECPECGALAHLMA